MAQKTNDIKSQILAVLAHPEAEDGLYFRNFYQLHEEDTRSAVKGSEVEILEALNDLLQEGQITADESGPEIVFFGVPKK